jgi:hypothetical protein
MKTLFIITTFRIRTFRITTLRIKTLRMKTIKTEHKDTFSIKILRIMPSSIKTSSIRVL